LKYWLALVIAGFVHTNVWSHLAIPAELFQTSRRTLQSKMYKLIVFIWNKEEFPQQWKESIIVHIYKIRDKTDFINFQWFSLL
jgi:hypothetical protein